ELINDPTDEETSFLTKCANALTSNQFDWGEALKDSVIGVISAWEYHEHSQLGQPTPESIQPLVVLMKRTVEGREIKKHIVTCPRLIQIATTDPYLTQDSINWPLINESTRYPWKDRNRVFRAFHSMACRTSKDLLWTEEKDIKNKIKTAHKTLHRILEESVEIISYNTKSDQIEIQTEGQHKVHSSVVPMSQSIAWAWQQCMVKAQEEKENKSSKVHHQGMSWLQQRFLLIVSGVMLVYERDVYNRALAKFLKTPRTSDEIANRRNELKGTVLNQLSLDFVKKNPQKALPPSRKSEQRSHAMIKVSDQEIQAAANEETYEFRRLALQTLALFMMFGTSGLFHVWVWKKEQKMTDAASLIHLSSVLANRRKKNSQSEPHVFYQRSWSRLDHHVFTILREFIDDDGGFKRKVNWPTLTQMFHDRFSPNTLSYLYSLDLCLEIHSPLSTRSPDGSSAPDFDFNQRKKGPTLIPITETFKSVWPSTAGQPVPVTNPKEMYLEADGSKVTKNHPLKAITVRSGKVIVGLFGLGFPAESALISPGSDHLLPQFLNSIFSSHTACDIPSTSLFFQEAPWGTGLSSPLLLTWLLPPAATNDRTMFTCSTCQLSFDTRGRRDNHVALAHQETINVTNRHGDVLAVTRQDGFFRCPMGDCTYQQDNPKYFGAHLSICKGAGHREQPQVPEKSDTRIVPLGEDIIASGTLSEYGLVWNERCRILICVQCHKGVPPAEVAAHRNADVKGPHVNKEQALDDLDAYTELAVQPISPVLPPGYELGKPCEPIQGLKIYNGYGCTLCHRAYPEMKTMKEHFRKKHNVLPGHDRSASPELQHPDAVKLLITKLDAHAAQSHLVADPEKDSQLSNWLYVSGIHHYIADLLHRGRTVEQIILPSEEIEPIQAMVPYISHWISTTMKRLHQTGQFLKRHCLAETTDVEDNKGLMPLQEQSSVDKYANTLARLMWFMIEESEKKIDSNTQFYNTHVAMLSELKAAIESITVNLHQQDEDCTRIRDPEIHDPISGRVCKILCAIFQLYCSAAHCQYWLPPLQFLARAMLKSDKSYDRPDNFTRLIAHIQYGVRMAFAQQFMDNAAEQGPFDPASDPTDSSPDDFSKFNFLHKNKSAPFNIMRQLMHLATTIYMSETMPDSTFWADHHQETLEINNKTVTLSGIRSCIQYQDKLVEANLHEIVKGCKLPYFDPALYSDKPNNTAPGFNYLVHSELTHKQHTF
ncbi:hypothetical protein DFH28DRAFT_869317, partial [Melampsora americana]